MTDPTATSPTPAAGVQMDQGAPVVGRDLCLLSASLLLHIMQIDREYAGRSGRSAPIESSRKPL